MSRTPEIEQKPAAIDCIFEKYDIPPLPVSFEDHICVVHDGQIEKMSLTEALQKSKEDLIAPWKQVIRRKSEKATEPISHHGRRRSKRQIREIRDRYRSLQENLGCQGSGKIIASIAANNESQEKARWTVDGLSGGEQWREPSFVECSWWDWVHQGVQNEKIGIDQLKGEKGKIIWSFYYMRYQQKHFQVDFWSYLDDLDQNLQISQETDDLLRQITARLS